MAGKKDMTPRATEGHNNRVTGYIDLGLHSMPLTLDPVLLPLNYVSH